MTDTTIATETVGKDLESVKECAGKILKRFEDYDILNALLEYKTLLQNYMKSVCTNKAMQYIRDEFLDKSVWTLMSRNVKNCWDVTDHFVACCKLLVEIAVPLIKNNHSIGIKIIHAMNCETPFFKTFGHNYQQKRGIPLTKAEKEALNEWRINEMKANTDIDYLFYNRWRHGRITEITRKTHESVGEYQVLKIATKKDEIPIQNDYHDFVLSCKTANQIAKPLSILQRIGGDYLHTKGLVLSEKDTNELKEWREELKEKCYIDYLYYNRWRYGLITNIIPQIDSISEECTHTILRIDPRMNEIATECCYDQFTHTKNTIDQLSKPLTKSIEKKPKVLEWRKNLKVGDKCDTLDGFNCWCEADIIKDDIVGNRINVKLNNGSCEWVYRDDIKLQKHLSKSTNLNLSLRSVEDELFYEDIEDTKNDSILIDRGKINKVSFYLVDIFNDFGKLGGFDVILDTIADNKKHIPIKDLIYILFPLSNIYKAYSKPFGNIFINKLCKLTIERIESLSLIQCTQLTAECMEDILYCLDTLFSRYYSSKEREKIFEKFELNVALKRLKCVSFDRQCEGMKFICDVCLEIHLSKYEYITRDLFNEWIIKNKLIQLFFGATDKMLSKSVLLVNGYCENVTYDILNLITLWYNDVQQPALIQKCGPIMRYIFVCQQFGQIKLLSDPIENIWCAMQRISINGKENDIWIVCYIIEELKPCFTDQQCNYISSKLQEMKKSELEWTIHHSKLLVLFEKDTKSIPHI